MERMPQRTEDLAVRLRRSVVAVAAAAAFAVGACAAPGGGASTAPTTVTEPSGAPAALTLELMTDDTLGEYVVGMDGKSLYIFTPDTGSTSNCNDECAVNWPPLTADSAADVAAGEGVTGAVGTITRADGSLQITLGGKPLYYFKGDQADGDINGQGLNDVWYVAGPDGTGLGMAGAGAGATDGPKTTPCPPADRTCY
jgi:predicted lipoprotein with Yx(FWY)xxD motif